MSKNPLEAAIEMFGGQSAMAELLEVSKAAVNQWVSNGKPPVERCPAIEAATKGKVTCEELLPDLEWRRDARGHVLGYMVRLSTKKAA